MIIRWNRNVPLRIDMANNAAGKASRARTIGFKSGERNVFFHILTTCNLSCKHCYINPSQHGSNRLNKETVFSWLDLFIDSEKKTNLILLGGEPTLHPDLAEIIHYSKKKGFSVTVDTNGYLHHNLLERTSPEKLDCLSFSLDGPCAEINDPIRGDNVFNTCTENIKKAVAKGFYVSLIYTVSGWNIHYLEEMISVLQDLNIKRFFIQVIGLRGESAKVEEDGFQITKEKWLEVVPRVAEAAAEAGIHVTFPKVFLEEDESFECAANVAENYFIFPNGRVYQCPLCEDHPIHSFEIKENQLQSCEGLRESNFFNLEIAEGCVMNKLLQPENISYKDGKLESRISCCMLKQEIV